MSMQCSRCLLLGCLLSVAALAQEPPATAAPAVPAAGPSATTTPGAITLLANTVIELEMVDSVSSRTSKPGDYFRLRVAEAIVVDGVVVVAAGAPAIGQVVHAQKARGGGKAGELILAARHLELPQGEVGLRSGFGATGRPRVGAAMATAVAIGVFGMLVKGKDLEVPAGHALSARLAADTVIPLSP